MVEQFSGEITEYQVFSSINTLSPTPMPNAPPEAPSPIIMQIIGTLICSISMMFLAMASPCPLSSASNPGNAPGVSIKQIIGLPNFSAIRINRSAFRYPSGLDIPKFLYCLCLVFRPFCWPISMTDFPSIVPQPPIIALSSFTPLSPCNSTKSPFVIA